ncbi:MAG TPA: hypothetical protein VMT63_02380 [Bacteroidales bacterium]|nr:hypothetical protein [Bacteroidales bacterium]
MADHYSNIDLVFRNGLREFEVLPPSDAWDGIRPPLRKKSEAAMYLKAAAIAGFLVGGSTLAWFLSGSLRDDFNGPAITLNQDFRPEGKYIYSAKKGSFIHNIAAVSSGAGETEGINTDGFTAGSEVQKDSGISPVAVTGSFLQAGMGEDKFIIRPLLKSAPIAALPEINEKSFIYAPNDQSSAATLKGRWSLGAFMTPAYYSKFLIQGNAFDKSLASSENSALSYSGGMSVAYKFNKRFSVQMGVYYNSLNQQIDEVKSYAGFTSLYSAKGFGFSVETSNGTIISGNKDIYLANNGTSSKVSSYLAGDNFDPAKAGLSYISNSILQNFNYLEVPFLVRYKVIDRSLGMNVIGGFSYNQLLNNSAYALANGNKYLIGSTDGILPVTLSGSFGLGMEYSFSGHLSFSLEPTLRYFLTPMSSQSSSSVHPYTFGIFSGLSWRF